MSEAVSVSILSFENCKLTKIQPYVRNSFLKDGPDLLLTSRLVVSIYSAEIRFAHHKIKIGYGIFLVMQWSYSVYYCLAEGKSHPDAYITVPLHVPILHLQSFSSGVFTPYTTNPSAYFMSYWGFSYLSSRSM
jgi:hypothetical protein